MRQSVAVIRWVAERIKSGDIKVYSNTNSPPHRRDDSTLDGDYTVVDETPDEKGDSGWTRR